MPDRKVESGIAANQEGGRLLTAAGRSATIAKRRACGYGALLALGQRFVNRCARRPAMSLDYFYASANRDKKHRYHRPRRPWQDDAGRRHAEAGQRLSRQ